VHRVHPFKQSINEICIFDKKRFMKQSDIKNNFHHLIDEIDNEGLLMRFYDLMIKSKSQKEGDLWNQLTKEQKELLLLTEVESRDPKNLIDHNTQKAKHKKWL
jgi:predicted component of type VI protein secretion system